MTKFNAGDKVYCIAGRYLPKVYTLEDFTHDPEFPLIVVETSCTFTADGKSYSNSTIPALIPATKENYKLLCKIFPDLTWEKPPKKPTPKKLITKMLNDGWESVPCYVRDSPKTKYKQALIQDILQEADFPYYDNKFSWKYAKPFDTKTGKLIIDYIDGKVILES
ncbi:hypothetical protein [Moraxella bovoculi]|uniref:hypothetical protein n=1 Tax=Moraxella bovoculi TaxID=386891 RepID=UPI000624E55F|nr:hypothetical protein [Moraxella bovoculi]AKG13491.1 hypothetical protein AAX11_04970 [Moraxella bovoculi]